MIRIARPTTIPTKITKDGAVENKKNCNSFDIDPTPFLKGEFEIKSSIYGHSTVKSVLKKAHHRKCCFCEKDQGDEYGQVEHFRPKKGYKVAKGDEIVRPQYFWLAYDWTNLLFVCATCNSAGYKGNLFPLLNEADRVGSFKEDIVIEEPLLLNPCGDKDPRDHISFVNEFPKAKTIYGKKTIEICGLDRDTLNDMRRKLIADIEARIVILAASEGVSQDDEQKARDYLRKAKSPEGEFSAAATDYINQFL
jgi:uncharacterized protein (TIGR02646 family)